jgi:hypothetical protein
VGNTVASVFRVPYEVVKQRLQAGVYANTRIAITTMYRWVCKKEKENKHEEWVCMWHRSLGVASSAAIRLGGVDCVDEIPPRGARS